jgi:O-methyltransferase involved in polyketide biosynthesis
MKTLNNTEHNFASVSPSANALLLLRGNTDIPYARQAAELIMQPEKYTPGYAQQSLGNCLRILHFEARYRSIDQLLTGLPVKNILELSSGFSFRGLDIVQRHNVHYIDTDLPGIIAEKKKLVDAMQDRHATVTGNLELLPLNALDEDAFAEAVNRFEQGAIAIVNEGHGGKREALCYYS